MKTIRDYLVEAESRGPGRPAQKFFQNAAWVTRSYAALRERVVWAAAVVQRLGIEPGRHHVALMLENGPEWQEIYLALAGSGVAVVPLDPKLRPQEAMHILRDSEAVAIFAGAGLACSLTTSLDALLACRFLQGVGAAAAPVIARAMVRDTQPASSAARLRAARSPSGTGRPSRSRAQVTPARPKPKLSVTLSV